MKSDRIIALMKQGEPQYENWTDESIREQLDAIYECGYEWFEENNKFGFKHKESGLYLKISGLSFYPPEKFKKTYEEVWSKDRGNSKARLYFGKTLKGILFLILGIIVSFFIKKEYSIILNLSILTYITYNLIKFKSHKKKQKSADTDREKANGDFVNTNEIEWCKNCINFKKNKGWQSNEIYQSEYMHKAIDENKDDYCFPGTDYIV